jgi:hypothetical protein
MLMLQTKLKMSEPNNRFEQEAHRVADEVMRIPDSTVTGAALSGVGGHGSAAHSPSGLPAMQRLCTECTAEEEKLQRTPRSHSPAPVHISALTGPIAAQFTLPNQAALVQRHAMEDEEGFVHMKPREGTTQRQMAVDKEEFFQTKTAADSAPNIESAVEANTHSLQGHGQPLAAAERTFLEPRFGYDFRQVRVHTDARATASAHAVQARAFTAGHDIVFGAGQHRPGTTQGRQLLAHELTHVVQRQTGPMVRPGEHEFMRMTHQRGSGRPTLRPVGIRQMRDTRPAPSPLNAVSAAIGRNGGTPLPTELQQRWSGRLGADLSGIRVHIDHNAARASGVRAMSFGSHLFFAPGAFDLGSPMGLALLGHEVAHALQTPAPARGPLHIGRHEPRLEGEADDVGVRLARANSQPIRVRSRARVPALRGDKQIKFSGTDIIVTDVYLLEGPGATTPGFLAKFQNALAKYYTSSRIKYRGYNVKFDLSVRFRTIGDMPADPATSIFWIESGSGRAGGILEITLYTTDTELTIAHEVGHYLSDYIGLAAEGYTENLFERAKSVVGLGPGGVATAKPGCEQDIMGTGNKLTACSLSRILDKAIDAAPVLPPLTGP